MAISIIVPDETRAAAGELLRRQSTGAAGAGGRFLRSTADGPPADGTTVFLRRLLATKSPRIFAESEISGDGRDWTLEELRLLGDISVAIDAMIFDDGLHHAPGLHQPPFSGCLVFTPGALLRSNGIMPPCDLGQVTGPGGDFDEAAFTALYRRRLVPVFDFIHDRATGLGKRAFVTVPGLGCGQFAGRFAGRLGHALAGALRCILGEHASRWSGIAAVYYDPYGEGENERHRFGRIDWLMRPLLRGNSGKSQLHPPARYAEAGDDFSDLSLHSIVAWDHVSWPGNDFWAGARATDDGVKAAATDVMRAMTGVAGSYDPEFHAYHPPSPWSTWEEVARAVEPRWWNALR